MKTVVVAILVALAGLFPLAAIAASDHEGHNMNPVKAASESPLNEGIVKKVDKAASKVTISHGPLINLDMPAMTMVFRVKEAAWIDQMKDGDKIRFLADSVNGALTIVRFEPAK